MATVKTLPNGMRVVTDTMTSVETVSIGVWVDVGTRHEPAAINGVAHLLEHMAFKGTARRSALDIAAEIEAVGGHLNAYTSREHTAYYAKVLKADLGLAVDILADILQHSTFDAAEIERERAVILQEIGQAQDTPDDIIFDLFQERAYPGQPMGQPVLGRAEIVKQLGRDTIADYQKRNYAAPGMILVAAGNLAHDGAGGAGDARIFRVVAAGASRAPSRRAISAAISRERRDLEQVHVVLGFPGFAFADRDYYAASVLSTALGGGMSSRLFQEIREKRGLAYSIYSFSHSYSDGGLFGVYAGSGEAEVAELMPVLCDEIVKLSEGLEHVELARARAQLKAGLLMSLEGTPRAASNMPTICSSSAGRSTRPSSSAISTPWTKTRSSASPAA